MEVRQSEEIPQPQTASLLENEEEEDLLELPPLEDDEPEEDIQPAGFITPTRSENSVSNAQNETVEENRIAKESNQRPIQTTQSATNAMSFSPDLIDAIAQRVIEKLSEQTVKEIAWEVVPQHADLIIKKMVEEKLKE